MVDALDKALREQGLDPAALAETLLQHVDALVADHEPAVLGELNPGALASCDEVGFSLLHALAMRSADWVEAALARGADPTVATTADAEVPLVPGADLGKYGVVRLPAGATPRTTVEKVLGRLTAVHKLLTKKGSHPDTETARVEQLERLPAIAALLQRAEQPDVEVPDEPQEVELAETSRAEAEGIKRRIASGEIGSPADLEADLERRARRLTRAHAFHIAFSTSDPELRSELVDRALVGVDRDVLPYESPHSNITVGQAVAISGAERHLALAAEIGVDWFAKSSLGSPLLLAVRRGHIAAVRQALGVAEAEHDGALQGAACEAANHGERAIFELFREAGVEVAERCLGAFVGAGWMDLFEEALASGVAVSPSFFGSAVSHESVLQRLVHHGIAIDAIGDEPKAWWSICTAGIRRREPADLELWKARVTTLLDANRLSADSAFMVMKTHGRADFEGEVERSTWIIDQVIDQGIEWEAPVQDSDGHPTVMEWALAVAPLWLLKHLHERGAPLPDSVVVRSSWEEADAKRRWLKTVTTLGERTLAQRLEDPQTFEDPGAVVERALGEGGTVFGLRLGQSKDDVAALGLDPGGASIQSYQGPGEKGHCLSWEIEGGEVACIRYRLVVAPEETKAYAKLARERIRAPGFLPQEVEATVFTDFTADGLSGSVELLLELG